MATNTQPDAPQQPPGPPGPDFRSAPIVDISKILTPEKRWPLGKAFSCMVAIVTEPLSATQPGGLPSGKAEIIGGCFLNVPRFRARVQIRGCEAGLPMPGTDIQEHFPTVCWQHDVPCLLFERDAVIPGLPGLRIFTRDSALRRDFIFSPPWDGQDGRTASRDEIPY